MPPILPAVSATGNLEKPPAAPRGLNTALLAERRAICVALKQQGWTHNEIVEGTGLTYEQVRYCLRMARYDGQLADTVADLAHGALPQAVENLSKILEDDTHENHWDATKETLKGLGAFKSHKNTVQEGGGAAMALQINFQMPDGSSDVPTVVVNSARGEIGANPRADGE